MFSMTKMYNYSRLKHFASIPNRVALAFACLFTAGWILASLPEARADIVIEDVRGRSVTVPEKTNRLLIDDGRFLIALSLIASDPVALVAAWPHDVNRIGEAAYGAYKERFPAIATKAVVAGTVESLSIEQVIGTEPDVAVFSTGVGPSDEQVRQIEAAGIPVVFIDFFTNPRENLDKSLLILGKLTGNEDKARDFVNFRRERLGAITSRIASNPGLTRPRVFFEAHAGLTECCNSPGKGNVGDYITLVGGHNIGADVLTGAFGRLGLEYIISARPEIYIASGGPQNAKTGGFVIGPGFSPDESRASLARMVARPGLASLDPVLRGEVHGIAHQLLNSPLDILVVERLARWIHPQLFADIDPDKTLADINSRFLAVPLAGPSWIELK